MNENTVCYMLRAVELPSVLEKNKQQAVDHGCVYKESPPRYLSPGGGAKCVFEGIPHCGWNTSQEAEAALKDHLNKLQEFKISNNFSWSIVKVKTYVIEVRTIVNEKGELL